ncbi:MAG: PqqD family peptide modification chaperone [Acidobacteriaceae bacterium]
MNERARITEDSVVQWKESPVSTEVDGEVVLMSLQRGRCYGLGETGTAVWKRMAQPVRIADLLRDLATEYDADPLQISRDVLELLEQLRDEGLVQVSS